jgi:uncharacterized protein (DUF1697 family)
MDLLKMSMSIVYAGNLIGSSDRKRLTVGNLEVIARCYSFMRFAVFLRAVNVGGTTPIRMPDLRAALEKEGLPTVTYLASGNLLVEATTEDVAKAALQKVLRRMAGRDVVSILRAIPILQEMRDSEPFEGTVTEGARRVVTFAEDAKNVASRLPLASPRGDLTIVAASDRELFSLYRKLDEAHALPSDFIESLVGRRCSTRYWETVLGLLEKDKEWSI